MLTFLVILAIILLLAPILYKLSFVYLAYFYWLVKSPIPFKLTFKTRERVVKKPVGFVPQEVVAQLSAEVQNKKKH